MDKSSNIEKWYARKTIVDIETAEVITESQYIRLNYRCIKKEKHYEFTNENNGTRTGTTVHTWLCKPNEQQRLWDGIQ